MKKITIYLISFIGFIGLWSCTDFLNVEPHNGVDRDGALENITDFQQQINDCYATMCGGSYWGGQLILLPDVMSANLILCGVGRQTYNEFFQFDQKSTTYGNEGVWLAAYNVILGANAIITRIGDEPNKFAPTADSTTSYGILAEAYAIRAMAHFDLVRLWAKRYDPATAATDPGVPYKKNIDTEEKPARNTVQQVYTNILEDLDHAEKLFIRASVNDAYNAKINHKLNIKAFYALKTRVLLTMAGITTDANAWTAVKTAALNAVKGDGTDMATRANFGTVWNSVNTPTVNNGEVLWRLAILNDDGLTPGNYYGQGTLNEYCVSYSFNQLFTSVDIRASVYRATDLNAGINYNGVIKWRGRGDRSSSKNITDILMVRTPEMYLTAAEACFNLGDETNAVKYLDYVRSRRYSNYTATTATGSPLYNLILAERRLELAFEGHRLFDLKRLNLDLARDNRGDQATGAGLPASVQQVPAGDVRFIWPIPEGEKNSNPNI